MPDSLYLRNIGFVSDRGRYDQQDWYQFTARSDEYVTIDFSPAGIGNQSTFVLRDPAGRSLINMQVSGTSRNALVAGPLQPGVHALFVQANSPSTVGFGSYSLLAGVGPAPDGEPNNTAATAFTVWDTVPVQGTLSSADPADWFAVPVDSAGAISIAVAAAAGLTVTGVVYGPDSVTPVDTLTCTDGDCRVVTGQLAAGDYFVKISRVTGSGSYGIVVEGSADRPDRVARKVPVAAPSDVGVSVKGMSIAWHYKVQTAGPVRVALVDVAGRSVRLLYDGALAAGQTCRGVVRRQGLAAGRYFVTVMAEGRRFVLPVLLH